MRRCWHGRRVRASIFLRWRGDYHRNRGQDPNRCFRVRRRVFWGRLEVHLFDEREETKEEGERMHL